MAARPIAATLRMLTRLLGGTPLYSGGPLGTPSSGTGTNITGITEAGLTLADNTTNNVSTGAHGFAPKLDNSATHFLNGQGGWTTPAGSTTGTGQVVSTETGAVATGTTVMPWDNTIPQNTEGDEYMTRAITPVSASSTLIIDVVYNYAHTVSDIGCAALFQDSTADALAAAASFPPSSGLPSQIVFRHVMTSGTTSSTTFKVRGGANSAATTTFNGAAGGRKFGGVSASSITIREILP